jgi:hypothetical protein
MATAFDGIGMSQFGSEKRFMTGNNPFSEGLKGIKDFAILSAIDQSGLQGFLNDIGKQKKEMEERNKGGQPAGSVAPDQPYSIKPITPIDQNAVNAPYMPAPAFTSTPINQGPSLSEQADEAMGLKTSSTFTGPNTFTPSPSATDTSMLAMASQPAPPPGNLNLPQYGPKQDGGGSMLSMIAKMFLGNK